MVLDIVSSFIWSRLRSLLLRKPVPSSSQSKRELLKVPDLSLSVTLVDNFSLKCILMKTPVPYSFSIRRKS